MKRLVFPLLAALGAVSIRGGDAKDPGAPWKFAFDAGLAGPGFVKVAASDAFSRERGYGFDLDAVP
jgi:hypothetical protein